MFMHVHLCETGYSFTVAVVSQPGPTLCETGYLFFYVHTCTPVQNLVFFYSHRCTATVSHAGPTSQIVRNSGFCCPVKDVHLLYHNMCLNLCTQEPDEDWIKFPRSDFMKNFKKKKLDPGKYPPPDQCILEMVNTQLKVILWCDSIFLILTILILFNGCVYTFFYYLNIQKQMTASAKKKINALKA